MATPNLDETKRDAVAFLERNAEQIALLSDNIFYFGEPGLQEHESAGLMIGLLEEAGFTVERGISGFETGFVASYGEGKPVIAVHCEYDGLPNNSQCPDVVEQKPMVEGAPGHCEGHNVNAAVMVASAIALKRAMAERNLPGTLKVFGAPGEELVIARPYFVRDGYFDDVDIAFHDHILGHFRTEYGKVQIACVSADFTFHGETAHAGIEPWRGRDALDAVVLMDSGMAQFREHMEPQMRAHRVITNGGDQPNVIPERASVWWYLRHPEAAGAKALFDQASKIAEAAAAMTNTSLKINIRAAVWPVRANRTVAEVIQQNIELVGMPEWSDDEQEFARALQQNADARDAGLDLKVTPLDGPAKALTASNDCGDISWKVPMGRLWFPATVPGVAFHHWTAGVPLTSSIAHKGALAGAKALTASMLDFLTNEALVAEA
ncbi:MAG: amidohydrolase, partial [Gammaproteobacteria bacterium]|nr:amidohydrolase [Gammaproteobacteria bacterium]